MLFFSFVIGPHASVPFNSVGMLFILVFFYIRLNPKSNESRVEYMNATKKPRLEYMNASKSITKEFILLKSHEHDNNMNIITMIRYKA